VNRRTLLTVSTAACLCGIYEVYALVVSPFFSPPAIGERLPGERGKVPPKPPENRRQAEKYLSDHPWGGDSSPADSKYQFRTEAGFFYFDEWEKIEQTGKVRFIPFAMIWREKRGDPADDPYTIVSESAVVEFAEKFEITNPHPGRVVGGALEGKVRIRGPQDLVIDGQDFNFAEKATRVWSDHVVRFQRGPHTGRGLGLELDLIPAAGAPGDDKPTVTGVRTVRLRKDVEMELVSEGKAATDAASPGVAAPAGQPDSTVFINSEGNFEYDVEGHVATFRKNVRVKRPTGGGESDQLKCETLTLIFEPPEPAPGEVSNGAGDPPPAKPEGFGVGKDLEFRRLRAEGPQVTVSSQRSRMQGWMNELTYDAQARVIALRDVKQVRLVQRNNELLCPEITAVLDEAGEIERALCRGAGKLFRFKDSGDFRGPRQKRPIDVAASWQKQLQKIPDTETGLDLIEFQGRAVLNRQGKESLQGDVVRIWVTPREQKPEAPGRKRERIPGDDDETIQPKRMLALRDVAFASPRIAGQTQRLEVWFDRGAFPVPPPASQDEGGVHSVLRTGAGAGLQLAAANSSAVVSRRSRERPARSGAPVGERDGRRLGAEKRVVRGQSLAAVGGDDLPASGATGKRRGAAAGGPAVAVREPDLPLGVTADVIRVRTLRERDDDDPQISEVITEGHVHVTQEHRGGELPLELSGERLHLWNYSEFNQVLDVSGRPAQVKDRGMELEGPEIHFDRGRNFARIEGAGVLRRPVAKGLDGKPLDAPQMLDVFWQEKMEFDGVVAKFFDNVRTQLNGNEMRCEEMHVTFNRHVSFSDDGGSESQNADIRLVVCRDNVDLKSQEYQDNRLVEVRLARGFEFAIDQATGLVTAQGPGTLVHWQRGNGKRWSLEASATSQANRAMAAEAVEWEYTRIDFKGKMVGNTKDRVTTFRDRVNVVYGPVPNLTLSIDDDHRPIDEDHLPKDGGWMSCNALQLTQHPKSKKQDAYLEMEATGNTVLEGRSFHALAYRVTYDQSKGLYVLTGDGKRPAQIWREARGLEPASQAGQRMEFNPARNEVRIDRAGAGQGSS
jgi:lipopolysaccharide export system protein LptA